MTDMKLYEIAKELREVLDCSEEWTDETCERVEALSLSLEVKADNICALATNLDATIDGIQKEIDRLMAYKEDRKRRKEWLVKYLKNCMEVAQRTEIEMGLRTVKIQKNPPHPVVDDEESIPPQFYVVVPQTIRLDKRELCAALKKGPVDGAHLEQGTRLVIK